MTFAPTPVDTSTTPIPMSSAVPDGTNTPLAIEGGPSISTGGNTLTPVSMYVKDGNDVTLGTSTDANTINSVMGRLTKIRDLLAGTVSVLVTNATALGQAVMASSSPVVISSDQSAVKVKQDFLEVAGQGTGVVNGVGTDLYASFDVSLYKSFSLQIAGTWSATLSFQGSNDNTNFVSIPAFTSGGATSAVIQTVANGLFTGQINFRYLRVRATAWASNASLVGTLELYSHPFSIWAGQLQASQQGTWTTNAASNNASVPTGAANTVVKNAAGSMTSVVVTTTGAGAGNVQIFDNASTNSGTVLFAFPATVNAGTSYQINGWAKLGMTAQNVASGPVFTVFYN